MERPNILGATRERVMNLGPGSVFSSSDFSEITGSAKMGVTLNRLEKEGLIRKVMCGIYDFPEYSNFLNEYIAPDPDMVAHALARKFGWTIVPCGDAALNLLGLSTQVPAVWVYVCDGAYKEYSYGKVKIVFKRTTNKEISKLSYKTALVVQALKALGKENITDEIKAKIREITTPQEQAAMLAEAKYATSWVYSVIKEICGGQYEKDSNTGSQG